MTQFLINAPDWELLRQQKQALLNAEESEEFNGLINLIDNIQDNAVESGIWKEGEIFGNFKTDFQWWVESDNVVKIGDNYITQCTQYGKLFTLDELRKYFKREYYE